MASTCAVSSMHGRSDCRLGGVLVDCITFESVAERDYASAVLDDAPDLGGRRLLLLVASFWRFLLRDSWSIALGA